MNKGTRLIKRVIALFLVLLLSIENFAAVVSDNDGSAFITKAEFDSLKNSFQSQIDQYNTSIDSKIDGAIAAYLAGIRVSTTENIALDSKTNYSFPVRLFYNDNSWNRRGSGYYTLSRPRVRVPKYSTWVMPRAGHATGNLTLVDDSSYRENATLVVPATTPSLFVAALIEEVFDIPHNNGIVNQVEETSEQRSLGGQNYKIFDLKNEGKGHQYIDYKVTTEIQIQSNGGHFSVVTDTSLPDRGFIYNMCLGLGVTSSTDPSVTQIKNNPENYAIDWTTDKDGSGVYNWYTLGPSVDTERSPIVATQAYNSYIETNVGVKKNWNVLMNEWNAEGSKWLSKTTMKPKEVDSANFVWSQNGRSYIFAGDSYMPAQKDAEFAFTPYWADGTNTQVTLLDYVQPDFHRAIYINSTDSDKYVTRWSVKRPVWAPPFTAKYNSGLTSASNTAFSGLPAACVRWYDEEGLEHYLDEGMFLKTFANLSGEANTSFEVTFDAPTSGTAQNLNFYVSKEPFNRVNAKTKLYPFKVDSEATAVTSKTLQTGQKYKITVEDIKKNDQLYILWEPVGGYNTVIELSSLDNFTLIKS